MIVCPNCNHQNPDGAVQCEACYTPLPTTTHCPNCGATVQTDASFCGQCGFNLAAQVAAAPPDPAGTPPNPSLHLPDLMPLEPLASPNPILELSNLPAADAAEGSSSEHLSPVAALVPSSPDESAAMAEPMSTAENVTHLQQSFARLLHIQTNTMIDLPQNLTVIHLGKPNDRVPPDIDLSGFPNSEIVSRIHADLRLEGDAFYIEDVGSSNGTYINNLPLSLGNRHRLRPGDRIALGKGDKVTFLFQQTEPL